MVGLFVLENVFGIQDGERPYIKNNKNRNLKTKKSSFLRDSSSYRYDIRMTIWIQSALKVWIFENPRLPTVTV